MMDNNKTKKYKALFARKGCIALSNVQYDIGRIGWNIL